MWWYILVFAVLAVVLVFVVFAINTLSMRLLEGRRLRTLS